MPDYIYVLTNPTMTDLVKIGRTQNLEERMRTLSSHAGVPVGFVCEYCCEVENGAEAEKHLHHGLDGIAGCRINPKREFFRIDPERARSLLQGWAIKNVTPAKDFVAESVEESDALNKARSRMSIFTFSMVGIPIGSELTFASDETIKARVVDDKKIEFEGNTTSLSQATKDILSKSGQHWVAYRGPSYWMYEGETLTDRRIRMEEEDSSD